jgi:hypothetical protein
MHYWKTILKGWLDDNATGFTISRAEEDILVHQAHRDIVNSVTLPQDILVGQRQNTFNLDDIISRDLKNIMNPLFQFVISPVALSSSHPFNIVFQ